ncbi:DUF1289 domain-containing protein [Bordetella genomosp. 1]|uniref:DUF1289 domain-containing protein n=1 Tax=Bordetella genomosp. 1 TaxID=1395607 RepID=A0A261RSS2_9BORD|nr:DUF1289 domain-containing protein [Bordetella genomosp. 1]MDQ8031933.1 DUF1289 domain-containing protein [Bordetella sp.]OZI28094.1 DUF1289 domain-containing protein [Bordetella genomosp. 1]OZI68191.1 DUF1289 domain-containing protein [Bordetella genomosp. 1]
MSEAPFDPSFSVTEVSRPDAPSGPATGSRSTDAQRAFTATDSPCVAICSTLFDEICRGCGRTAMEVSNWVFMTDEEKQAVWTRIRAQGYPRRP